MCVFMCVCLVCVFDCSVVINARNVRLAFSLLHQYRALNEALCQMDAEGAKVCAGVVERRRLGSDHPSACDLSSVA